MKNHIKKKFVVFIEPDALARAKEKAHSDGLSLSSVIRTLVNSYSDGLYEVRLRIEKKEG